jgi:hypothetical protein
MAGWHDLKKHYMKGGRFMGNANGKSYTQKQLDHYSDQNNPNNEKYQAELDNHANQLNPNNNEYWHSRGEEKPES